MRKKEKGAEKSKLGTNGS